MGTVGGADSKLSDGRGIFRPSGCDGKRESQVTLFVSPKKLLRQIDEDQFLTSNSPMVGSWKGGKLGHLFNAKGDFDLSARHCMPAINSIKSRNITPSRPKEFFQSFSPL